MRKKTRRPAAAVLMLGAALGLIGIAGADATYDVADLGLGVPVAINSGGTVLGFDWQDGIFMVSPDGTRTSHATAPEGWTCTLSGLGENGIAWGRAYHGDENRPVVWDPADGAGIDVARLSTADWGYVFGMERTGWTYFVEGASVFAWHPGDPDTRLEAPHLGDRENVQATSFRDSKVALIAFDSADWEHRVSYVWDRSSGTTVELEGAKWVSAVNTYGEAAGVVAGDDDTDTRSGRATWWSADGEPTDLQDLLPSSSSSATVTLVSDSGWVAGTFSGSGITGAEAFDGDGSSTFSIDSRWTSPSVFAWNARTGDFYDLSDDIEAAGGVAAMTAAISEDGTVAGHMWVGTDQYSLHTHVFVWNAATGLLDLSPSGADAVVVSMNRGGKVQFDVPASRATYVWQRAGGIATTTQIAGFGGNDNSGNIGVLAIGDALSPGGEARTLGLMNDLGQVAGIIRTATDVYFQYHLGLATPHGATETGEDVVVQPDANTSITFDGITAPGETTVFSYLSTDTTAPTLPDDFQVAGTDLLLNISTTAQLAEDALVHLAIHYDDAGMSAARESQIRLLHYDHGTWTDVTDYEREGGFLDTENNVVHGVSPSLSPFAIVLPNYTFGGFESPVAANGSSVFKIGSVVPLKFGLTGPAGIDVSGAVARLALYRITSSVLGTVEQADASSAGNANTGDLFRRDSSSGKFIYNLATRSLSQGTYRADVSLDDGSVHSVRFSLRNR